ncbi:F0F1 ATP synthase subunit B [Patescibacteria group bacterium]|nr:F0F1 ATP synthase subunit B [Patescibacteria group bacterium]MBU4099365.1 F0F1 ATP synthase subunit B [Patescibacteria group bacterium]
MEILNDFGINWMLMVAQIINFLIILYVLKRFLYKPIFGVIKKREQSITEGLKHAEDARILLEKTAAKEKDILKKAQEESKKLLEETKKQRDEIFKSTEVLAQKRAGQILEEAKKQITFETNKAKKELSLQVSGLAVEFIQSSVGELFSKEDQDMIVNNAITKIRKRID